MSADCFLPPLTELSAQTIIFSLRRGSTQSFFFPEPSIHTEFNMVVALFSLVEVCSSFGTIDLHQNQSASLLAPGRIFHESPSQVPRSEIRSEASLHESCLNLLGLKQRFIGVAVFGKPAPSEVAGPPPPSLFSDPLPPTFFS